VRASKSVKRRPARAPGTGADGGLLLAPTGAALPASNSSQIPSTDSYASPRPSPPPTPRPAKQQAASVAGRPPKDKAPPRPAAEDCTWGVGRTLGTPPGRRGALADANDGDDDDDATKTLALFLSAGGVDGSVAVARLLAAEEVTSDMLAYCDAHDLEAAGLSIEAVAQVRRFVGDPDRLAAAIHAAAAAVEAAGAAQDDAARDAAAVATGVVAAPPGEAQPAAEGAAVATAPAAATTAAAAAAAAAGAAGAAARGVHAGRPPPDLCCPILKELFVDPVFASDGETYEREAIERWFAEKLEGLAEARRELEETGGSSLRAARRLEAGVPSPMGHGKLAREALQPARTVKRLAEQWRAANTA